MSELELFDALEIRFSKRKTVVIHFQTTGWIIKAPQNYSRERILKLIKLDWAQLWSKWIRFQEKVALQPTPVTVLQDGKLRFLGQTYNLAEPTDCLQLGLNPALGSFLGDAKNQAKVRSHLTRWYKQKAAELFQTKCEVFARGMGVDFRSIKIHSNKRRVGCCNTRGDLKFSWRILMLSESVVDYLVIHELAHRVHHNHSPKFWALVKQFCPSYKQDLALLQANAEMITGI